MIGIEEEVLPFGVKISFEEDYIVSSPISDGNTVETLQFLTNDNLSHFKKIGKLEFIRLLES